MVRQKKQKTTNTNRFQYTQDNLERAYNAVKKENLKVAAASKLYKVPRSTLRRRLSGEYSLNMPRKCGPTSILGKHTEECLVDWLLQCAKMGFPVHKEGLLFTVKKIIEELNLKTPFTGNKPGDKWFYSFLKRHPVLSQKRAEYVNRARGTVTETKIRGWFSEVKETLGPDADVLNHPERVFNMDETCFCLAPKGELIIGPRGQHVYNESSRSDKENITTIFSCNAAGQFSTPTTLFKYERLNKKATEKAPIDWGIGKTENGWMTSQAFFEYFANIFDKFLDKHEIQRPVVVFLDGHKSHLTLPLSRFCRENQIILIALYPNSTHIMQPLDVAVFGPLKKHWKKIVRQWRIDHNGVEISKFDVPTALSKIIKEPTMPANIRSGFKASGLYPFEPNNVDYSKIVLHSVDNNSNDNACAKDKDHLDFIESRIEMSLLRQFKSTRGKKMHWEGNPEALMLYEFWLSVADELGDPKEQHAITQQNKLNNTQNLRELSPMKSRNQTNFLLTVATEVTPTKENSHIQVTTLTNITPLNESQSNPRVISAENSSGNSSASCSLILPKKTLATVFEDIVRWPHSEPSTSKAGKRKKEYTPSVVTSDKWIEFFELKDKEKQDKIKQQQNRKEERERKKREKEQEQATKKSKKLKICEDSSSEDNEEEWEESGSSLDDIDSELAMDPVDLLSKDDLRPGNFILVAFKYLGKRSSATYKYVASITKINNDNEVEVHCLKSIDSEKRSFAYIENDIWSVNTQDILGKLPEPTLVQDGRSLKTVFPSSVEVFEKQ